MTKAEKELENDLPAEPYGEVPGHVPGGKAPRLTWSADSSDVENTGTEDSVNSSSGEEEEEGMAETQPAQLPVGDFTKMSKEEILKQLNHMQGMFAAYRRLLSMGNHPLVLPRLPLAMVN